MPPTSGMKPIPTSGIAIFDLSVTTRRCRVRRHRHPAITIPSITATYGRGTGRSGR